MESCGLPAPIQPGQDALLTASARRARMPWPPPAVFLCFGARCSELGLARPPMPPSLGCASGLGGFPLAQQRWVPAGMGMGTGLCPCSSSHPPCRVLAVGPGPSLAQRLEPLRDHLSIARLPEVLPQLRALLAEEHRALEELVTHLQRCLEDEHRAATGSPEPEPEPTMAELQEQRRAMERDLQQGRPEPAPSHSHSHARGAKPSMTPAPPSPPSCPPSPRSPMPYRGALLGAQASR
ncbi:PREDICTED: coiled-coil domain-containing protein 24 [Gavialis gangeticus]|uniref:coiled-coil domain-containing protein 24 n=1 Tax=Gavialis gangeticus TaxID=94835 RepID=UPI00092F5DC6|nr:PREDICTED: coiled-coil domain-containing protein 24 [Gavialis gangeticus]